MGWGWSAPGSGAVGRGRAALLSCWPPFGAPVWSVKRPVSPHTPWGTACSCQALLRPSRRTEAGEWGGPSCRPSGTQAARELGTGTSQEGGRSPGSSCRPDLLLGGSGSPRPVTQCPGPSPSGGRAGVTASVPGPACGDCPPGLPMTLLAGAEHRGPPTPRARGPLLPREPGCPVHDARSWHQLAPVVCPMSSRPCMWGRSRNPSAHPSMPWGSQAQPPADWIL